MKKQLTTFAAILLVTVTGCIKENCTTASGDYLRLDWAYINMTNKAGVSKTVQLESNTEWKINFIPAAPDWAIIDKTTGTGNGLLQVKTIKDNNTGICRLVTIVALPVKSNIPPVRLTVGQCDSSFKDTKQF